MKLRSSMKAADLYNVTVGEQHDELRWHVCCNEIES